MWSAITLSELLPRSLRAGFAAGGLDERVEDVDFVVAVHVLQDGGQALQAHAGVDAGRGQFVDRCRRAAMSNCMNTLFQISMKRSPSSSGLPGGPPGMSGPWS